MSAQVVFDLTLCIETVFPEGSLCLAEGNSILCEKTWARGISHSELLTYNIELALNDSGLKPSSIKQIIIDHGPGSFTGIRVGINATRALAFALNIPVFTVTSLEVSAWLASNSISKSMDCIEVVTNAYQGKVFYARYGWRDGQWLVLKAPQVSTPIDLKATLESEPSPGNALRIGDGWSLYENLLGLGESLKTPTAVDIYDWFQNSKSVPSPIDWKAVLPLYLRASGAEERR